ncbi:MAG: DUF721 domain-containing protein [Xanthomonadaceae bacterium]|nr:DUF721 domain-containing protein [Xanthomonadaceae bacterium]
MPGPTHRRLDQVLSAPKAGLAALTAHARLLSDLDRRLRPLLDPTLAAHCRVAAFREGRLTLSADLPSFATRLRYHTEQIREKLAESGLAVVSCRVIVVPPAYDKPERRDPPAPLSAGSARAIEGAADGVTHPPLADALRRLAKNRKT